MTQLVRGNVSAADPGKRRPCHRFRHGMATQMLVNGADIRLIQAMLCFTDPATTEIYTQVSIRMLKQIHAATHPGRPMPARSRRDAAIEDAAAERDTLLAVLDAEAEEEDA